MSGPISNPGFYLGQLGQSRIAAFDRSLNLKPGATSPPLKKEDAFASRNFLLGSFISHGGNFMPFSRPFVGMRWQVGTGGGGVAVAKKVVRS